MTKNIPEKDLIKELEEAYSYIKFIISNHPDKRKFLLQTLREYFTNPYFYKDPAITFKLYEVRKFARIVGKENANITDDFPLEYLPPEWLEN